LADAATALRGFIPADATLDDVRRALHGMGFAWTGAGELTYCPNARLLDEFDELIDAYGRDAPAALLFTAIDDKQAATWRSLPERADPGAVIFGHQHA